ncbi:MAG: ATP-binding protein [Deltaproteobacteria bacterium]|nr:ATP-binding protein [Deltaproteobacteria bacterium]
MSQAYELKPWTKVAVPHDDILKGDFDLSSYAANLGQVEVKADGCPAVYKDPVAFFEATYRTAALDELLQGVANVLAGGAGNRVVQLRTPFGGGKTHTLIALLHLFRSRAALDEKRLAKGIADPGPTRVAVVPCLDLNAATGRSDKGLCLRTMWGEIAFRLGDPDAYQAVREDDELRVNPGGDKIRRILEGRPTLILLDEVLSYVEAALGVPVGAEAGKATDTNLGRQSMLFLQHMTEVVRGLPHCAMVYTLQQSVREAVGDEGLLEMLDSLVSRLDAKKEPVAGDDVLRVVQRRLFKDLGEPAVRQAVAREYAALLESFLLQSAETESEQRAARDQGTCLQSRILDAYPFHPELLDLMYHRWGSLPTYQRTRGALQFLATVIGALWKQGDSAGPLIGAGDVSLADDMVRSTFFSQVGEREAMKSVLDSDLLGAGARCKRVDEAIAADAPAYQAYRPGTRLTRALALYSFGAKPGEDRGVLRSELLAAVQMPGLPADVLDVALQGLSDHLLYIHTSARRYRFEKRPNLNKLVDDEVRKIEPHEVAEQVRTELEKRLSARGGFEIWPQDSGKVPDRKPRFTVVFLGPEHALDPASELEKLALEWTERCGAGKRSYRNALAFALPSAGALDGARTAARRMAAVQRLLDDKSRHGFEKEDVADLGVRKQRAATDLLAAVRQMYPSILMPVAAPRTAKEPVRIERFEIQGFQSLSAGLMESIYRALENWVFEDAKPRKLVSCVRLGEGELGSKAHWISGPELVDQFFGSVHFPKLLTLGGLKQSVAHGVSRGAFGYVMGGRESEGTLKLGSSDSLSFGEEVSAEDIDLSEGSYVVSAELARTLRQGADERAARRKTDDEAEGSVIDEGGAGLPGPEAKPPKPPEEKPVPETRAVQLRFRAKGGQLFKAFSALQNLSEWADEHFEASVTIDAAGSKPLDENWYEMSVVMPLDEEGVEIKK